MAGEHLREASGDERHFGDPQIQKSIAMFKKVPNEATFEDLTLQSDPTEELMEVEQQPFSQELAGEVGDLSQGVDKLPQSLTKLISKAGWQSDTAGNPVVVSHKAWAFRTPEAKHEVGSYPYRTTWARFDGVWSCLEKDVKWVDLENPTPTCQERLLSCSSLCSRDVASVTCVWKMFP